MDIGKGWPIRQESARSILIRTAPILGPTLHRMIWRPKTISDEKASNLHSLWVIGSGGGKTRKAYYDIKQRLLAGWGGVICDAAGVLSTLALRMFAEEGLPPEKCILIDPTVDLSLGRPILDSLDPREGMHRAEQIEKLVSATATISDSRNASGFRQLHLARHAFYCLSLANAPMTSLVGFLQDPAIRSAILKRADDADEERFWTKYYPTLPKDAGEALLNKWEGLLTSPLTRDFFNQRGPTVDFFQAMQEGIWIVVNLSEHRLAGELRMLFGQLMQFALKQGTLQRQEVEDKPPFFALMDEFQQYASDITSEDLVRLSRNANLSICLYCQDTGSFTDRQFYSITGNADTVGVGKCSEQNARALAAECLPHFGSTWKDWESTRNKTPTEEINEYAHIIQNLPAGQVIVRSRPQKDAYIVNIPHVSYPKANHKRDREYLEAIAGRWYRKPSNSRRAINPSKHATLLAGFS